MINKRVIAADPLSRGEAFDDIFWQYVSHLECRAIRRFRKKPSGGKRSRVVRVNDGHVFAVVKSCEYEMGTVYARMLLEWFILTTNLTQYGGKQTFLPVHAWGFKSERCRFCARHNVRPRNGQICYSCFNAREDIRQRFRFLISSIGS